MGDRATGRATSWAICACGRTLSRGGVRAVAVTVIRERGCPPGACLPNVGKTLDPAVWQALRLKPTVLSIEKGEPTC